MLKMSSNVVDFWPMSACIVCSAIKMSEKLPVSEDNIVIATLSVVLESGANAVEEKLCPAHAVRVSRNRMAIR